MALFIPGSSRPIIATRALDTSHGWFAVYCRSRHEKKLSTTLRQQGFEAFLPLIRVRRQWSDRIKSVEVPLLPNYLFVGVTPDRLKFLSWFPGFVRIVEMEGRPCRVRPQEMELMHQLVAYGRPVRQTGWAGRIGDRVRIKSGPLRNWEGRVERQAGEDRVVFQLDSLHQALSVEVNTGDLELIR